MATQKSSHDDAPALGHKAPLFNQDFSDSSGISPDDLPEFIDVNLDEVRKEFTCPICLGIIQKTKAVMECLDRFCSECIEKAIGQGENECPACGTHFAGHRSLRNDLNYDALITIWFQNVDKYEDEIQSSFSETTKPLETAKSLDSAKGISGEDGGNASE